MTDQKEYHKKYRQEHKEETKTYRKKYNKIHKEEMKVYGRKYMQVHKKELKQWRKDHKKEKKEYDKIYRKTHSIQIKILIKMYYQTVKGKEVSKKHTYKRRRQLGFEPLNKYFEGAITHHITNKIVVYIPEEIHSKFSGYGRKKHRHLILQYYGSIKEMVNANKQ